MSNQDPGTDSSFERLDLSGPSSARTGSGRRYVAAVAAAGLVGAAIGGGIWAWQSFVKQGAQPAEALPANTLAYAALDLDPPGGQKAAAFNLLRQVPSIKRELGLGSVDDVHRSVVDEVASESGCDLDYSAVKPWLGDRLAYAVVAHQKPENVLVLQVEDDARARTELDKASGDCGFGFALDKGWAVLARNDAVAARVSKDTGSAALSGDEDFRKLTAAAGDAGLVTLYAAPEAGPALLDVIADDPFSGMGALQLVNGVFDPVTSFIAPWSLFATQQPAFEESSDSVTTEMEGSVTTEAEREIPPRLRKKQQRIDAQFLRFDELSEQEQSALIDEQEKLVQEIYGSEGFPGEETGEEAEEYEDLDDMDEFPTPEVDPALRASLQDFTGIGGIGRIADGGFELEVVGDDLGGTSADMYAGSEGGEHVSELPDDTAIAFGAGFADGWVDQLFEQLSGPFTFTGQTKAESIAAFEKATGLSVPGDVEALGGEGMSVVAGPSLDLDDVFEDPTGAPVAVRVTGDADRIEAALEKVRSRLGGDGEQLVSRRQGDSVVVGVNAAYLDDVAKAGDLGGSDPFRQVVPGAEDATTVLFLNFDAGDWLVEQSTGQDRRDARPFAAFGLSVTRVDGEQHLRLRLAFDD